MRCIREDGSALSTSVAPTPGVSSKVITSIRRACLDDCVKSREHRLEVDRRLLALVASVGAERGEAMVVEPFLGNTAVAERSFVFISYSRRDAAWAQRVGVLLKPLLRRKQLRLWADSDLHAGDSWCTEIME